MINAYTSQDDSCCNCIRMEDASIGAAFFVSVTEAARIKMKQTDKYPDDVSVEIACYIHDEIEKRHPMFTRELYEFDVNNVSDSLEKTLASISVYGSS